MDTVFNIAHELGIATGQSNVIDRNRYGHISTARVGWIHRHGTAVWIGQLEILHCADKNVGRNGSDIETAQIIFTAHVKALIRWSFCTAKPVNKAGLEANSEGVLVVERLPLRESKQRPVKFNVSA